MTRSKYTIIFVITVLLSVLLNISFSFNKYRSFEFFNYEDKIRTFNEKFTDQDYIDYSSGNYSSYSETEQLYSVDMIKDADRWLNSLSFSEYESTYTELKREYNNMEKIIRAYNFLNHPKDNLSYRTEFHSKDKAKEITQSDKRSYAQIKEAMKYTSLCMSNLEYAIYYESYVTNIKEQAETLAKMPFYSDADKKQYRVVMSDYLNLEFVNITAVSDDGIILAFSDNYSHIIVIITAVFCAFLFSFRYKSQTKKSIIINNHFAVFSLIAALGIALIYASNQIVNAFYFPYENSDIMIQSYKCFYSCPFIISLSSFSALNILLKTMTGMFWYFIAVSVFSNHRNKFLLISVILFTVTEIFMYKNGIEYSLFSFFDSENIAGEYDVIFIFGNPVHRTALVFFILVILLTVSVLISRKCVETCVISAVGKSEEQYFDEVTRRYNEARQIRHDIKNHMSVISIMLDAGDTEGIKKYIGEICEAADNVKPPVKTGSKVVDALLFRKYAKAKDRKIPVETEFLSDLSLCGIKDYDLCSIFSNILDNAIEASVRLIDDRRHISLKVKDQMDMICIICENNYSDLLYSAGKIVTLKDDKTRHGIGLKRIEHVAGKYGGAVDVKTDNHVFTISVLLMKQKNKPLLHKK